MKYEEIKGDLINLALEGKFDIISHGCNCQCIMGSGIAPLMGKAFNAHIADKEYEENLSNPKINIEWHRSEKLGNIDWWQPREDFGLVNCPYGLTVVNSYTQFDITKGKVNLDYEALTLCMRKINHVFKGKHIGLPQIGAGLGGGNWTIIKKIIQAELKDCDVTIVIFDKK